MDFSQALDFLKDNRKIVRKGWNGPNQYLQLQQPDSDSKMTLPYIFIKTTQGHVVPWIASQTDLLADDWELSS